MISNLQDLQTSNSSCVLVRMALKLYLCMKSWQELRTPWNKRKYSDFICPSISSYFPNFVHDVSEGISACVDCNLQQIVHD